MNASASLSTQAQTGFGRQVFTVFCAACWLIGAAAYASKDIAGDAAPAAEEQPPPSEAVSEPQINPQPAPVVQPAPDSERVTLEQIDEALERFPAPAPDKVASREHKALVDASAALREEQTWLNQRTQLESAIGGAEAQLEGFAAALESASNPSYPDLPGDLDGLEKVLTQHRTELTGAKSRLEELGNELSSLPENRLRGVNRTNELEVLLRDLNAESSTTEVDTLLQRARRQNTEAELAWVKLSVSSTDSLRSLITSEQELLRAEIANLEARVAAVTEQTAEQRRLDLEAQEEKARRANRMAALQDPELQILAEENQAWLDERREIEAERTEMEERIKLYESEATSIRSALESIKRRLGIAGNSPAIGALIQREKMRMPDMRAVARTRARINRSMRDRQIQILELELVRSELVNRPPETTSGQEDEFAIAESLWIPNKTAIKGQDLLLIPGMMSEVSRGTPGLFEESVFKSRHRLWITLVTVLVLAVTVRLLRKKAFTARSVSLVDTRFLNLMGPFIYEVIVAALPAAILRGAAWILEAPDIESIMAFPIGNPLSGLVVPVLFGVLLVRLCDDDGIGRLLFGWPRAACNTIQRTFYRFIFPAYGVFYFSGVLENYGLITGQRTGSRFVTLAGLILIIIALHHIFHARHGIVAQQKRRGLLETKALRRFIHIGLVAWPP
jgi:hypothetical protein